MKGGRHATLFTLQSDLDYVRGIQSVRMGVNFDGGDYRSDDSSNYLGTYYFDSPQALEAGQPRAFVRRIGNPDIAYRNVQAAVYIQDDIRVRKGLTLSPGIRYEAQTHLNDYTNFGPRMGVTWAPFKNGKTSLRASWGVFYDWLGSSTYEQTLRVDGVRQRELNIPDPPFPDPGDVGTLTATNRYLLGAGLPMARNTRVSAGIDQTISPRVRFGAHLREYARRRPVAGREPQRSNRRGKTRPCLRQRRPGRRRRGFAATYAVRERICVPCAAVARLEWTRVPRVSTGSAWDSTSTTHPVEPRTTPTGHSACRRAAVRLVNGARLPAKSGIIG